MSKSVEPAEDRHGEIRAILRVIGPILLGIGGLLIATGVVNFFVTISDFGHGHMGPPRYFWCIFLGMPFVAIGAALTKFAYIGPVLRYLSRETTPVATETFNEVAEGTRGGLETMAHAVGRGVRSGIDAWQGSSVATDREGFLECAGCHSKNPCGANFCNQCGASFEARCCPSCGMDTPPQSRYCTECGQNLQA